MAPCWLMANGEANRDLSIILQNNFSSQQTHFSLNSSENLNIIQHQTMFLIFLGNMTSEEPFDQAIQRETIRFMGPRSTIFANIQWC